MKKILALLILLTLVVSVFTACKKDETPADDTPVVDDNQQGTGDTEEPTLEDAKIVVRDLYKDKATTTAGDFNVVASVVVDGVKFTVTWSSNNANVQITESTKDNAYLVDIIPEEPEADIEYVLTATITAPNGETLDTTFKFTVPKFKVNTHAEYLAAEDAAPLVVEGVVYGIMSKSVDDGENSIFVQDLNSTGGYYLYNVSEEILESVKIGDTIRVRGNKKDYNGTPEIVDAAVEIRAQGTERPAPVDITNIFTAATMANDKRLTDMAGAYVTIKGVTVLSVDAQNNTYYCFELDGVKTYLRISGTSNCTTKAEQTTIVNNHSKYFYYTADVTGTVSIYNGKFYLAPVTGDAFSNFSAEQLPLPDDVKAGMVKDALTLPTEFVAATPYTLPTTGNGATFADVTIAWALAETTNATLENGVLTPVMPAEGSVNITLTATITKGEAVLTRDFTITIKVVAPITLTEAAENALLNSSDKYIVVGTIKSIANTTYGNVYIQDAEGNELYIYGMYDASGAVRFDKLANQPKVGDKVVLYGVLTTYNGTAQMKNGWLLSLEHGMTVTVVDPTCNEAGYTKYEYTCECGLESTTVAGEAALGHNFVDGVCSRCQAQDHQHSYTSTTTDPTCTAAGVITYTCACNDSYTEPGEAALGHIDENGDFKCDRNCGANVLPEEGSTLTIAQALAIGALYSKNSYSGIKYYITGTVVNVENTTYGNMNITDGTNTILVYGVYSADGTVRYDAMETKPVAGDTITVYGEIGFYSAAQMKNGWMTAFTAHECDYTVAATCEKALSCSKCGAEKEGEEALGHTANDATCTEASVCSVCEKKLADALGHNFVDGACTRCQLSEDEAPAVVQTTASKTIADCITEYGWTGNTTKQEFNLDDNVTVKINGGANTGKAYDGDHIRIYATDSPAGTITISVKEGYELVSVKVTCQTGTYAFLQVDGGNGADISNVLTEVSGSSVLLNSVKNGTNGKQVRVTAIEVVYQNVG